MSLLGVALRAQPIQVQAGSMHGRRVGGVAVCSRLHHHASRGDLGRLSQQDSASLPSNRDGRGRGAALRGAASSGGRQVRCGGGSQGACSRRLSRRHIRHCGRSLRLRHGDSAGRCYLEAWCRRALRLGSRSALRVWKGREGSGGQCK